MQDLFPKLSHSMSIQKQYTIKTDYQLGILSFFSKLNKASFVIVIVPTISIVIQTFIRETKIIFIISIS